jgi:hypothetical protein
MSDIKGNDQTNYISRDMLLDRVTGIHKLEEPLVAYKSIRCDILKDNWLPWREPKVHKCRPCVATIEIPTGAKVVKHMSINIESDPNEFPPESMYRTDKFNITKIEPASFVGDGKIMKSYASMQDDYTDRIYEKDKIYEAKLENKPYGEGLKFYLDKKKADQWLKYDDNIP